MGHNNLVDLANYALSQGPNMGSLDYTIYGCIAARITGKDDLFCVVLTAIDYSPARVMRQNMTFTEMIDYIAGMDTIVITGLIRQVIDYHQTSISMAVNTLIGLV